MSGYKASSTKGKTVEREAARKAVETKGPDELSRAARQAAWTRKHGKDDAANPHSRMNQKA
jgi:hypothetical protein